MSAPGMRDELEVRALENIREALANDYALFLACAREHDPMHCIPPYLDDEILREWAQTLFDQYLARQGKHTEPSAEELRASASEHFTPDGAPLAT